MQSLCKHRYYLKSKSYGNSDWEAITKGLNVIKERQDEPITEIWSYLVEKMETYILENDMRTTIKKQK